MEFPNVKRCNVIVYVADVFFFLCLGKYFSLPRGKNMVFKKNPLHFMLFCAEEYVFVI